MYAAVMTEPNRMKNGSLQLENPLEKLAEKLKYATYSSGLDTHEMIEMDEILRILTAIQVDGARRDERLAQLQKQMDELVKFREERTRTSETENRKMTGEIEEIHRKIKAIEERGLLAWTWKRIMQAAALTAAISTVGGCFIGLAVWVVTKLLK